MELAHPLSVQFTQEQLLWLDSRRSAGISRSAALRILVDDAMRRDQQSTAAADRS
jgi:hypothetical protein